jgi:acyl-CoA dehydrogenase
MSTHKGLLDFTLSDELVEVGELIRNICEKEIVPRRAALDEKEEYPFEIFAKFKEAGLPGIMYDAEYGGMGADLFASIVFSEIVSEYCLGVNTAISATKLGALPIEHGGTEEQKMKYLPKIASGEKIAAFALTEPRRGSDVPALKTHAVKKGDRYILNGTKQWITNAGVADIYTSLRASPINQRVHAVFLALSSKKTRKVCRSANSSRKWAFAARTHARSSWKTWKCQKRTSWV